MWKNYSAKFVVVGCMYVCMCMYVCIYLCMYGCTYVCMYAWLGVHVDSNEHRATHSAKFAGVRCLSGPKQTPNDTCLHQVFLWAGLLVRSYHGCDARRSSLQAGMPSRLWRRP